MRSPAGSLDGDSSPSTNASKDMLADAAEARNVYSPPETTTHARSSSTLHADSIRDSHQHDTTIHADGSDIADAPGKRAEISNPPFDDELQSFSLQIPMSEGNPEATKGQVGHSADTPHNPPVSHSTSGGSLPLSLLGTDVGNVSGAHPFTESTAVSTSSRTCDKSLSPNHSYPQSAVQPSHSPNTQNTQSATHSLYPIAEHHSSAAQSNHPPLPHNPPYLYYPHSLHPYPVPVPPPDVHPSYAYPPHPQHPAAHYNAAYPYPHIAQDNSANPALAGQYPSTLSAGCPYPCPPTLRSGASAYASSSSLVHPYSVYPPTGVVPTPYYSSHPSMMAHNQPYLHPVFVGGKMSTASRSHPRLNINTCPAEQPSCVVCSGNNAPWRRGPLGLRSLCNSCGHIKNSGREATNFDEAIMLLEELRVTRLARVRRRHDGKDISEVLRNLQYLPEKTLLLARERFPPTGAGAGTAPPPSTSRSQPSTSRLHRSEPRSSSSLYAPYPMQRSASLSTKDVARHRDDRVFPYTAGGHLERGVVGQPRVLADLFPEDVRDSYNLPQPSSSEMRSRSNSPDSQTDMEVDAIAGLLQARRGSENERHTPGTDKMRLPSITEMHSLPPLEAFRPVTDPSSYAYVSRKGRNSLAEADAVPDTGLTPITLVSPRPSPISRARSLSATEHERIRANFQPVYRDPATSDQETAERSKRFTLQRLSTNFPRGQPVFAAPESSTTAASASRAATPDSAVLASHYSP